jgi:hypothetical protein
VEDFIFLLLVNEGVRKTWKLVRKGFAALPTFSYGPNVGCYSSWSILWKISKDAEKIGIFREQPVSATTKKAPSDRTMRLLEWSGAVLAAHRRRPRAAFHA